MNLDDDDVGQRRKRRDKHLASARLDGIEVSRATLELIDRPNEMNVPADPRSPSSSAATTSDICSPVRLRRPGPWEAATASHEKDTAEVDSPVSGVDWTMLHGSAGSTALVGKPQR